MTTIDVKKSVAVRPLPTVEDLSKEVEQSVERRPDERVVAVRVFDNCYRCNWWVRDAGPQGFLASDRDDPQEPVPPSGKDG